MHCRYCNADLVAGAQFCPNCGKPVESGEFSSYEYNANEQPAANPPDATPIIQSPVTPVNQPALPDQQQFAPAAPPAQSSQPLPPTQPPQQPLAGQQPSGYLQWPVGQQPGATPQWPAFQGQQPVPSMQPTPFPQAYTNPQLYQGAMPPFTQGYQPIPGALPPVAAPPKKSGLSPAVVVLLVILALLVGGGGVFAYNALAHHSPQTTATSTRSPSTPTRTVPTITTTDPQLLYMQATSGTPILNDPLNTSNPNGWTATTSSTTCTFPNNTLQISTPKSSTAGKTTVGSCLASGTNFNNFAYEVNTTIAQGDVAGIVFRNDPFAKGVYLFGIDDTGAYLLLRVLEDSSGKTNATILSAGISQAIKTGTNQTNLLTVIARSTRFDLYANQQYVASVTDSSASGGQIGVYGQNSLGGAVSVTFSSIKVWQL